MCMNTLKINANILARNVKSLRKNKGWSQEEFADKTNMDRTYASQIERAIANPSLSVICRIADAFDTKVVDLLI